MGTIAFSALMGGLLGALVGGAVYYLDNQDHAYNIAYWAAGGVLLGTGVGIINVAADESRAERAVGLNHPKDPVPTYRVSLLNDDVLVRRASAGAIGQGPQSPRPAKRRAE